MRAEVSGITYLKYKTANQMEFHAVYSLVSVLGLKGICKRIKRTAALSHASFGHQGLVALRPYVQNISEHTTLPGKSPDRVS